MFLGCFILYWILTFIYVAPPNYIKIKASPVVEIFQTYLSQRWSFFAPPPTYNSRLYYVFEKSEKSATIEVLHTIELAKKSAAPFNTDEEIVDYVLSGSLVKLENYRASFISDARRKNTGVDDTTQYKIADRTLPDQPAYRTLLKYAESVALKNNFNAGAYDVYFYATHLPIPKFSERYNPQAQSESLVFTSKRYRIIDAKIINSIEVVDIPE